jgi:hypothetical protein
VRDLLWSNLHCFDVPIIAGVREAPFLVMSTLATEIDTSSWACHSPVLNVVYLF